MLLHLSQPFSRKQLHEHFRCHSARYRHYRPGQHCTPNNTIAIIYHEQDSIHSLHSARWGWAGTGHATARAELASADSTQAPAWIRAWTKRQTCVIPAHTWVMDCRDGQYAFSDLRDRPCGLAGIWRQPPASDRPEVLLMMQPPHRGWQHLTSHTPIVLSDHAAMGAWLGDPIHGHDLPTHLLHYNLHGYIAAEKLQAARVKAAASA